MAQITLGNIVVMLTVYTAALIFAVQHVADRYSPQLIKPLLLHKSLWTPLVLIALGVIATYLILFPVPPPEVLASCLLLLAILIGLGGSFFIWYQIGNGFKMVRWLEKWRNQQELVSTLQEILLNAIQRGDQRITSAALQIGLDQQASEESILRWLIDQRDLLKADWLLREMLNSLPADGLRSSSAEYMIDLLSHLFTNALDEEAPLRVEALLEYVMKVLEHDSTWTEAHSHLLYMTGFALWNRGDPGSPVPRIASNPSQLGYTQMIYFMRVRNLWYHMASLKSKAGIELFCGTIARLAEDTLDDDFVSCIEEVIYEEDVFRQNLFTRQALHILANGLGRVRLRFKQEEMESKSTDQATEDLEEWHQEWIEWLIIHLAALLVGTIQMEKPQRQEATTKPFANTETKGEPTVEMLEETSESLESSLSRLLGNGYLFTDTPREITLRPLQWLSQDTYAKVGQILTGKNTGKRYGATLVLLKGEEPLSGAQSRQRRTRKKGLRRRAALSRENWWPFH